MEAEVVFFSSVAIDHVFSDQSGNFKYIVRNILYFHLLTREDKLIFVVFGLSVEIRKQCEAILLVLTMFHHCFIPGNVSGSLTVKIIISCSSNV